MTFAQFLGVMTKQMYVWRMAANRPRENRSAQTRLKNAQRRMDDAVLARALTIAEERRCAVRRGRAEPDGRVHVYRCEYQRGHGKVPGRTDRLAAQVRTGEYDHGAPGAGVWWNEGGS